MNPINLIQMMKGGNPQQIVMQMMNNPQIANNPMAKNMIEMAKNGNLQGIEEMGRNIAKEKEIDFDKAFSDFKSQFNPK
uniref:hypothetical protein n=1 Tax=Mediterraneibacter faecis TaxID=592978 RepID=UPI0040251AC8